MTQCQVITPLPVLTSIPLILCFLFWRRKGCYWGCERYLRHNFATKTRVPGRIEYGQVGFLGPKGSPKNPSYQDVCTGTTGYVEVYDLEFQGGEEYYEAMVRFFFQFHDPTTVNKQGNDAGTQYASVIYCYDQLQFDVATKVKDELQHLILNKCIPEKCYKESTVTTDIRMVDSEFVPAHEAHQDYLMKNPRGYCNHRMYLKEWPKMEGSQNTAAPWEWSVFTVSITFMWNPSWWWWCVCFCCCCYW